ncbi:hypothetical protein ASPSYDRAFT_37670 [Aspergillus sydowii CBS 593.65]|uniref:Uncharacterized protein n=1 Tax=Aspergillus sydowii CBS 593.65 TaxID=1036612 RepID=A0A1L9SXR7_9EURO|nr:uncharacterized protein ASPSYDRAFT_37670 [Aspergillus sydowii CBS 593.65]OJJ52002.1 hypothetical protein ASPSYDRAFT_37670 [Aspergillus sydowii CBS 593.65]
MWTTNGHVISSAGLTSHIRLKALKTIAHGNTTFHSTNIPTNIQDTLHFHAMMQKQEDSPQGGFLTSQRHDNVFEKIHTEEDVFRFISSTSGLTTNAKDISAKSHTTQTLGDVSDNTLQKINDRRVTPKESTGQQSKTSQFAHYGEGQKLGKQT